MAERTTEKTEKERLNLYQKLSKIGSAVKVVKKSKKGYNYSYSDIVEILARVKLLMERYGVSLVPKVCAGTGQVSPMDIHKTKFAKDGTPYDETKTEMLVSADMAFIWVDNEDPEQQITVPWFVTGMQEDPSQAFGSGLTYCTRYFLTEYFQIAQDNDVDKYKASQKQMEEEETKSACSLIVNKLNEEVTEYLKKQPGKKEEVAKFMAEFVKGGNYFNIKEPLLAAKLKDEFAKKFLTEDKTVAKNKKEEK